MQRAKVVAMLLVALLASSQAINIASIKQAMEAIPCENRRNSIEKVQDNLGSWLQDMKTTLTEKAETISSKHSRRGGKLLEVGDTESHSRKAVGAKLLAAGAQLAKKGLDSTRLTLDCGDGDTQNHTYASVEAMAGIQTLIQTGEQMGLGRFVHITADERHMKMNDVAMWCIMGSFILCAIGSSMIELKPEFNQPELQWRQSPLGWRIMHFFGLWTVSQRPRFTGFFYSVGLAVMLLVLSVIFLIKGLNLFETWDVAPVLSTNAFLRTQGDGPFLLCRGATMGTTMPYADIKVPSPTTDQIVTSGAGCYKPKPVTNGQIVMPGRESVDRPDDLPVFLYEMPEGFWPPITSAVSDTIQLFMYWHGTARQSYHPWITVNTAKSNALYPLLHYHHKMEATGQLYETTFGWETSYNHEDERVEWANSNCDDLRCGASGAVSSAVMPFGPSSTTSGVIMRHDLPEFLSDEKTWCQANLPIRITVRAPDASTKRVYLIFPWGCTKHVSQGRLREYRELPSLLY